MYSELPCRVLVVCLAKIYRYVKNVWTFAGNAGAGVGCPYVDGRLGLGGVGSGGGSVMILSIGATASIFEQSSPDIPISQLSGNQTGLSSIDTSISRYDLDSATLSPRDLASSQTAASAAISPFSSVRRSISK